MSVSREKDQGEGRDLTTVVHDREVDLSRRPETGGEEWVVEGEGGHG